MALAQLDLKFVHGQEQNALPAAEKALEINPKLPERIALRLDIWRKRETRRRLGNRSRRRWRSIQSLGKSIVRWRLEGLDVNVAR
jgi:hypothetical protein